MDISKFINGNIKRANDASDPNQLYRWMASIRDYMKGAYQAVDALDAYISSSVLSMQREAMTLSTRLAAAERHLSSRLHSVRIDSPVPVNISSALSPSFDAMYDPYIMGYTLRSASYHNFVTDKCTISVAHHVGSLHTEGLENLSLQRSDKLAVVEITTPGYEIGVTQYPWLTEATYQGAPIQFGGAFLLEIDPGMAVFPNHVALSTMQPCDIAEVQYYYATTHNADMVFSSDLTEWSRSGSFSIQVDGDIGKKVLVSNDGSAEIHHTAGVAWYLNGTNPYITIQQARTTAVGISKFLRLRASATKPTQVSVSVAWFDSGHQYLGHERHRIAIDSPHYTLYDVELFPPKRARYCRIVLKHNRVSPSASTLKIAHIGLYHGYERFGVDAASNEYIGIRPSMPISRLRLLVNLNQSSIDADDRVRYRLDITDVRLGYNQLAQKGDLYIPDIAAEEGVIRRISVIVQGSNLENCYLVLRRNANDPRPETIRMNSDGIECSFLFVENEQRMRGISSTGDTVVRRVVCPPALITEMFTGTATDSTVRLKYAPLVDTTYVRNVLEAGMEYNPNAMPTDPAYWKKIYSSRLGSGAKMVTTATRDWLLYLLYPTGYSRDFVQTGVIRSEWIGVVGRNRVGGIIGMLLHSRLVHFDTGTTVTSYWQPGDFSVARVSLEYAPSQPLTVTLGSGDRYNYVAIRVRGLKLLVDQNSPDPVYHVSATINGVDSNCIWAMADSPVSIYTIGYVIISIPDNVSAIHSIRISLPVLHTATHVVAVDRKLRLSRDLDGYPPVRVTVTMPDRIFVPDTSYLVPTGVYSIERERVRDATVDRVTEYERQVSAGRIDRSLFTRTDALKALQFYPVALEGERYSLQLEVATLEEDGTIVFREIPTTGYTLLPDLGLIELFYDLQPGETVYATYKFVLQDDATAARFVDLNSGMSFTRNITDYVNGKRRKFTRLETDRAHPEYHPVIEYIHSGRTLTFSTDMSHLRGINAQLHVSYRAMVIEPKLHIELHLNDQGEPPVVTRVYAYKEEIL
jgi:hypothetical protein